MTDHLPVNAEAIMVAILRADQELMDAAGGRIATSLPREWAGEPAVRLLLGGGGPIDPGGPEWTWRPIFDVQVFAKRKADAREVMDLLLRAVRQARGTVENWGVVSTSGTITGPYSIDDDETEYPGYYASTYLVLHPSPSTLE